ncbi:uncharacterized protein Mst85C [Eurosta solidaginis]|uniref:uncharacterized protein Mst85C n=1 Tax=Eurosta solidaginis TaxID=178769 RepID=UPI003531681B
MHYAGTEPTAGQTGTIQQIFTPPYQQSIQTIAHSMPTPPPTPWNLNTMPWKLASTSVGQNGIMEFSAHVTDDAQRMALHQKRKSNLDNPIPTKQFISEEKITAHFNGLHISSDFIQNASNDSKNYMSNEEMPSTSTGKCFTNLTYKDYQMTAKELEKKLRNANRITLCEELKRYQEQEKKDNFLPEALLNRIEKPCTALVLWQPPPAVHLLHRMKDNELTPNNRDSTSADISGAVDIADSDTICDGDDDEFCDAGLELEEIDDFVDNNNTCRLDFNSVKADDMDEDL